MKHIKYNNSLKINIYAFNMYSIKNDSSVPVRIL